MDDLLSFLVKEIVEKPKEVEVLLDESQNSNDVTLIIDSNPEDVPLIIGRKGRTIKALRNIVGILALKENKRAHITVKQLVTAKTLIVVEEFELTRVPIVGSKGEITGEEWNIDLTLKAYSYTVYGDANLDDPIPSLPSLSDVEEIVKAGNLEDESSTSTEETSK